MEVLEFALQTIRRVDSGGSVGDDVSHPRRMHGSGGNDMLIKRMASSRATTAIVVLGIRTPSAS